MRLVPHIDSWGEQGTAMIVSPRKVCMHVLGAARTDVRVLNEATALVEAGFSVSIVDVESERMHPVEEDICGVCLKHIIVPRSFVSTRFTTWTLLRAAQMLIRSTLQLIQTPADIYHSHDEATLPACFIAAQVRRKPLIFDAHERPLTDMSIRWRRLSALATRFLAYMIPRCAGIITVSPLIAQEIQCRYRGPEVSLIRNVPVYRYVPKSDRLRQHLGLSPDVRIALYQGNIESNRRLDILIRAAPFLEQNTVIVLMGSGRGEVPAQLEALIASERVADRVKIILPVPYEELLDWTASADIGLIVYSPDASLNIQMCLPNKLFEYLMAGLPVLSSQLDAVGDVIRTYDIGQIVSSLAPADVGAAVNTMLGDCVTLARMRRNALNVAQELCWEKERQQLFRLYYDILTRQNTGLRTDSE